MFHTSPSRLNAALVLMLATTVTLSFAAEIPPRYISNRVDQLLREELLSGQSQTPVANADDESYLRRIYLDIIGQVPPTAVIVGFTLDTDQYKREKMINQLLAQEEYGMNWARYWRDVIMYRRTEERAGLAAEPLENYLAECFNKDKSWKDTARSFITAEGNVREAGEAALIVAQSGVPEDTVAEISRIFMGIQIQCAQCHDHPTDRWKRNQFHELAAFFPRVTSRQSRGDEERTFYVVAQDRFLGRERPNNLNRPTAKAEHFMPDLEKPEDLGKLMTPVFFATGQRLEKDATDEVRRGSLATWLTSSRNPWFAKAIVNRMWSELVGEGFYEPVDDMGPDRECNAPRTLEFLSEQFVNNNYDIKWLFRAIMATEAYQRESRSRRAYEETPFLANCNQRLRGDQLYSSLVASLDLQNYLTGGSVGRYGARRDPRAALNQQFGFDPSLPREELAMSIPQALFMMNSPQLNAAMTSRPGTVLGRMLVEIKDDESLLVELYLKILSREPTNEEISTCLSHVRSVGNRNEAFEDLLWALINSTEFLHRR